MKVKLSLELMQEEILSLFKTLLFKIIDKAYGIM